MKIKKLNNEQSVKVSVEIIELNKELCAFKAVQTTTVKNKVTIKESEGINLIKNVRSYVRKSALPYAHTQYIKSSDELLELMRLYGYVDTLLEKTSYNGFKPLARMEEIIKESKITFEEVKNSKDNEILESLIYLDRSTHACIKVSNGKMLNIAKSADRLMLTETAYKDYEELIHNLVKSGRVILEDDRRKKIFFKHCDSSLKYIKGRVVFSDHEYDTIVEKIKPETNYLDCFNIYSVIKELDLFKINHLLKSEEEKESDWLKDNEEF